MVNEPQTQLLERIEQLAAEARGDGVSDAIAVGAFPRRHIEGAEQHVEDREGGREVARAAAVRRRMMPAMEDGTGEEVFERAQGPVQIGMHKSRMADGERPN